MVSSHGICSDIVLFSSSTIHTTIKSVQIIHYIQYTVHIPHKENTTTESTSVVAFNVFLLYFFPFALSTKGDQGFYLATPFSGVC